MTMVIVSPQCVGLWDPFHMDFYVAYKSGVILTTY